MMKKIDFYIRLKKFPSSQGDGKDEVDSPSASAEEPKLAVLNPTSKEATGASQGS
jgi:hypothetical protein